MLRALLAELACAIVGHEAEPLIPLDVIVLGGEGHRPWRCTRCKRRINQVCDDWFTRAE